MKELFQNVFFKMFVILVLILILIIPAVMVQELIHERMMRQQEAVDEVSSSHAREQTVTGPLLNIPFRQTRTVTDKTTGKTQTVQERKYFHILPDHLIVNGSIDPEKRKRGLFEVMVYKSDLNIEANFGSFHLDRLNVPLDQIEFNKAFVSIGINDLKGLSEQVRLKINDSAYFCNPGVPDGDIVSSGLHVPIQLDRNNQNLKMSLKLDLKGSQQLMFVPVGKETVVNLNSSWKDPSFGGEFLPHTRQVDHNGFHATWKVLHLNRNFPQEWIGERNLDYSSFGVDMKIPVDVYQKSMRVAKYALLFIVLTYLVFFFVEILNKILIHPIQYILVGIALVLFYLLMLSFSEHIYFDYAYFLAALMTITLIFFYAKAILHSRQLATLTALILTILYGFIFVIIQMQDYALIFGSIGVFIILAITMYFSRKINWFELKKEG